MKRTSPGATRFAFFSSLLLWMLAACSSGEGTEPAMQPGELLPPQLLPQGSAVTLNEPMQVYIKDPDSVLSLETINDPETFLKKTGIPNRRGSELYMAKSLVNVRLMFSEAGKIMAGQGNRSAAWVLDTISRQVSDSHLLLRPAHQFNIDGSPGNRVLFYGGENELENGPGHANIDALSHDLGMPMVKVMTHFDAAQGGSITQILEDGVGGMTHLGWLFAGWDAGRPVAILSEWPADYGRLDDDNRYYNAHLLAIDYQAGTSKTIPDEILAAYHQNYASWDAITGLIIPYTQEDKIEEYQDYTNNPLEVVDRKSLLKLADVAASLDKSKISFTSYCAEGQWNVANLAVNVPIYRGRFPKIDALIEAHHGAPGFAGMSAEERRRDPRIGWEWLKKQGILSAEQYKNRVLTRRTAIYPDWVPATTQPWTRYQPQREDGLIADPLNLGTLVRMLLRMYYPREEVSRVIAEELKKAYRQGGFTVRAAIRIFMASDDKVGLWPVIKAVLFGETPFSATGKQKLHRQAFRLASSELGFILRNEQFKERLFKKLGYDHIVDEQEQWKVNRLYEQYVDAVLDPALSGREEFDSRMAELDDRLSELKVRMKVYGPDDTDQRSKTAVVPFFMWAPPQGWVFWAKHPDQFHAGSIRYVATAMHYEQSRAYKMLE
jgi:hypothetical protein